MYREKLKNYIDNSDVVEFIINIPDQNTLLNVKFNKDGDDYFCITNECKEKETGKYVNVEDSEELKDNIDDIPEDVLKMFVQKWEQMIVEEMLKNRSENYK